MTDKENKIVATNINDFEPSLWHFVGQHKAVYALTSVVHQFFNDKVENRSPKYPVVLLTGNPGSGRRTLAYCLHLAFGSLEFREAALILGTTQDHAEFFKHSNKYTTFYVPNFTQVSPIVAGSLINIIRDKVFYDCFLGRETQAIPFNNKLIILSTCSNPNINPELLKYIDFRCDLTDYSADQIYRILKQRVSYLGWKASDNSLQLIAKNAQGNAGRAMQILQYCYVVTRGKNKNKISISEAQKALVLISYSG